MERPEFEKIKDYQEFSQYYWYRDELKSICKNHGISHIGTKKELNENIKAYFNGEIIKQSKIKKVNKADSELSLDAKLLECGFVLNGRFREYFAKITGIDNFKFTADMATALRKVRKDQDLDFTIKDLLAVYQGNSSYAKYDNSSCQWNQFLKDFCADQNNKIYRSKIKAASVLWQIVKNQPGDKKYHLDLIINNRQLLEQYKKLEVKYD